MKYLFLWLLLGASLAMNALLFSEVRTGETRAKDRPSVVASAQASPASKYDPKSVLADARAHHWENELTAKVLAVTLEQRDASKILADKILSNRPWLVGSSEALKRVQALQAAHKVELAALTASFGPLPSASAERDSRFGSLAKAKIEAVKALERRHNIVVRPILRFDDLANFALPAPIPSDTKRANADLATDLHQVLTDSEVADYAAFNSLDALKVQQNVSGIDIPEAKYLALVAATQKADAEASSVHDDPDARRKLQDDLLNTYRCVLGDSLFAGAMSTINYKASVFDTYAVKSGLSEKIRGDVFVLNCDILSWGNQPTNEGTARTSAHQVWDILSKQLSQPDFAAFKVSPLGVHLSMLALE